MRKLRVYADTSVFGGCFDPEFTEESKQFFEEVKAGKFLLVVAPTTVRELDRAPERVQGVLASLPPEAVEIIPDWPEITQLGDAYIEAGVLGRASRADAEHVAAASVADVDLLVSWNFRHIVHYDKISAYHAVNLLRGYKCIRIFSPKEVAET